jgi:hypothetical protein
MKYYFRPGLKSLFLSCKIMKRKYSTTNYLYL